MNISDIFDTMEKAYIAEDTYSDKYKSKCVLKMYVGVL